MTKLQKVLCVLLSINFLMILAYIPDFFFMGENIFRQLPLYCFLEEQANLIPMREDPETSAMIVASNAVYLAYQIQEENADKQEFVSLEETPTPVVTPIATDVPVTVSLVSPTPTPAPEAIQSAAMLPNPSIDLSPERLADFNYLLNQFFIVDSGTSVTASTLNAKAFLEKDLTVEQGVSEPQILIYHSHSQEAFADSRPGRTKDTIVGVGAYLARILEKRYGYQVLHVKETFDMIDGVEDRNRAYDYARAYLEPFLKEHPSIEVVIDLHRDGVAEERRLVTKINGKDTAQIMFFNGLSYTNSSGSVSYLPNPYIQDNLAFSFQLEYQAAQYYPDFCRGIYLAGLRYNLHLRPKALLLEAGAQTNTVQEVKNAMEPFADILHRVLSG